MNSLLKSNIAFVPFLASVLLAFAVLVNVSYAQTIEGQFEPALVVDEMSPDESMSSKLVTAEDFSSEGGYQNVRQLTGLAIAEKVADVSTTVSQRLIEIHVKEGDRVKRGQLLATLESSVSRAEFEAANAIATDTSNVNVALIDAREANFRFARFQQAYTSGASNQMELELAENELKKALARYKREKSNLVTAQKTAETAAARQEAYFIRTPFDGVVTEQHVQIGNLVNNGDTIFTVVAASKLRAELYLPIELFGKLQTGETYTMNAGAPVARDLDAKLKFISPTIDPASQTFRCVFEIDNSAAGLPAGFSVRLADPQVRNLMGSN